LRRIAGSASIVVVAAAAFALAVVLVVPTTKMVLSSVRGKAVGLVHLRPLAEPSTLYYDNGTPMAVLQNGDFRVPVSLSQISPVAVHAVIDVEDSTFYFHGAVDLRSVLRATARDVFGGGSLQGGSTITQQLIKNSLLTPQRTISRKLHEAVLAYRLEQQMTKSQILDRYLNTIYFGNGAYGIEAAAEVYFAERASQLDAAQAAMLAGMISDPVGYDPVLHPAAALQRRNVALQAMESNGTITARQAVLLDKVPLPSHLPGVPEQAQSAFVQDVEQTLLSDTTDFPQLGRTRQQRIDTLYRGGLQVTTSLDPTMQWDAQAAVNAHLPDTNGQFTAAVVSVDPKTGFVRALVPGNSASNGYDVVTGRGGTGRQPGSSFKPFVLMAALDNGYSPSDLLDGTSPCNFELPGAPPVQLHNAEAGSGLMTVQAATQNSVNCAYLRLGLSVGLGKVVAMAHRLGIQSDIPEVISESIGSADVTPLEMAAAYATIDDDGIYHRPSMVEKVLDVHGRVLYGADTTGTQVVPAQETRVTTQVLRTVVESGTGTAAALPDRQVAGKTGTTDTFTNGWFIGYTPQLVTAVWMGSPAGSVPMTDVGGITVFGGTYPAEIWHSYMDAALSGQPAEDFPQPNWSEVRPQPRLVVAPYAPGSITFPLPPGVDGTMPPGALPPPAAAPGEAPRSQAGAAGEVPGSAPQSAPSSQPPSWVLNGGSGP
jgi:penicillin-binding protein 1A